MKHYTFLLLALTLFGCQGDDQPTLAFTQEQLILMHGGSEKTWSITEIRDSEHPNQLSPFTACHTDDRYTFFANSKEIRIAFGAKGCFWESPDQQSYGVDYEYYEHDGTLILGSYRGEGKGTELERLYYIMMLKEISETHMLFIGQGPSDLIESIRFELAD